MAHQALWGLERKWGPAIGLVLSALVGVILTPLALVYFAFRPKEMAILSDPEQVRRTVTPHLN